MEFSDLTRALAVYPRPASTEVAFYEGHRLVWRGERNHSPENLRVFPTLWSQIDYRVISILEILAEGNVSIRDIEAAAAPAGILRPLSGGAYEISEKMVKDLRENIYGSHVNNLGAPLVLEMAALAEKESGRACLRCVVDPMISDEMLPEARITGIPEINRVALFNGLSHRGAARLFAENAGDGVRSCADLNLVVAFLGVGFSIAAQEKGRVIDINNPLDGEGPFSMCRSGALPARGLVELCYSGKYDFAEIMNLIHRRGGLMAHLSLSTQQEIALRLDEKDLAAREVLLSMAWQVAREIGARAASLRGKVDGIVIAGPYATSTYLVQRIQERVEWIAPVKVFPSVDELAVLAEMAQQVASGREPLKTYDFVPDTEGTVT